jgi:lipoprotein NlpD
MRRTLTFFSLGLVLNIAACSTSPPAPVIDRLPANTGKSEPSNIKKQSIAVRPLYKAGDWRPDTYTVKKGDNLYSIGLEFGYDYKDIAQANNISAPYHIKVGQVLKLNASKDKPLSTDNSAVEINPIKPDSGLASINISEPKGVREPYSDEALNKAQSSKPSQASEIKTDNKVIADPSENLEWAWPTKGKVVATFNESSNKGVDIAGAMGQAVNAAGPGRVIYSGSDLRGYGKLVIIKHNPNYLSVYAHNNQILVKEGQQISLGQKIAEMGSSDSNTVKLHFEIRRQGKSVDPLKYLTALQ